LHDSDTSQIVPEEHDAAIVVREVPGLVLFAEPRLSHGGHSAGPVRHVEAGGGVPKILHMSLFRFGQMKRLDATLCCVEPYADVSPIGAGAKFDEETVPSVFKTDCRLSQSPHVGLFLDGVGTIAL